MAVPVLATSVLVAQAGPSELWRMDGTRASERLASSIAQIDDIDGDKFEDYLVGGPSNGFSGATDHGVALLISGRTGKILRTHKGAAAYDYFGTAVTRLGDLDGDGVDEYAISASRAFLGSNQGSVYVYSGKTGVLRVEIKANSTLKKSDFGASLASIADVDADGVPDILVGAPLADVTVQTKTVQTGRAFVYSGKTGKKIRDLAGSLAGDGFGHALCGLEDLDKDGVGEFLVAAPQSRSGRKGYVRIYSGKSGKILRTHIGDKDADHFARSVARIPDMDGDKIADFVVGAPQTDSLPLGNGGYVRAFGSVSGKTLWTRPGTTKGEGFGHAMVSIGDVDGDGFSDVAASTHVAVFPKAPGQVRILSGRTGTVLHAWGGVRSSSQFGMSLAAAGDRNADGRPDVLVGVPLDGKIGAPEEGSVRVISAWPLSFRSDRPDVSVLQGGKQRLDLDAGVLRASKFYLILGSQSGIHRGLTVGGRVLPLNLDAYMGLLLAAPNSLILPSVGVLDSNGRARAWFSIPAQKNLSLIGLRLDHAYVVFGATLPSIAWTSNPVSLTLTK